MKATARKLFSAATGLGLAAFTLISAFTAGFDGATTVVAFALLAIYGLIEIALVSYAAPRFEPRVRHARPPVDESSVVVRVSDLAEVPESWSEERRVA